MSKDLSIAEFEAQITTYVGLKLLKFGEWQSSISDIVAKYAVAANNALREKDLTDFQAIYRNPKAYIIYKPTGRIACEIGVDGVYEGVMARRTRGLLLSRRGFVKEKTMLELMAATASKGDSKYKARGKR